ncbi:MAG: hypothetical protein KDA99_14385 [Planctomycetales bacterium]|nr:hypothetical protein [Planctomycetales bacterium]
MRWMIRCSSAGARLLWSLSAGTLVALIVAATTLPATGYAIWLSSGGSATFPSAVDSLLRGVWRIVGIEHEPDVDFSVYGPNGLPRWFMPAHISCCAIGTLGLAFTSGLLVMSFLKERRWNRRLPSLACVVGAMSLACVFLVGIVIVSGLLLHRQQLPPFWDYTMISTDPINAFFYDFPAHYPAFRADRFPLLISWITCACTWWLISPLRHVPMGRCQACGYDIRLLPSEQCPECGAWVASRKRS